MQPELSFRELFAWLTSWMTYKRVVNLLIASILIFMLLYYTQRVFVSTDAMLDAEQRIVECIERGALTRDECISVVQSIQEAR